MAKNNDMIKRRGKEWGSSVRIIGLSLDNSIDDVVKYFIMVISLKDAGILNIGTGNGVSVKMIIDYLKLNGILVSTSSLPGKEIKVSIADVKKLKNTVDFNNNISVLDFVKQSVN